MKKISVVFLAMFLVGSFTMMFGQATNFTSIIQNGNSNTADVISQVSYGGTNTLLFWQNGNGNFITAQQTDFGGYSEHINQGSNYSEGEQNGNSNYAKVSQDSKQNTSYLKQHGDNNQMYLDQKMDFIAHDASITSTNFSQNIQSGNYNEFTLAQTGDFNTSDLWQDGFKGKAWVNQTALNIGGLEKNTSNAYQNGNENQLTLEQILPNGWSASKPVNSSKLEQNGNTNYASIHQIGEYADNTSDILQHGDYNNAYLKQQTQFKNTSTNVVDVSGDGNYLKVSQGLN